jgi:sortase A
MLWLLTGCVSPSVLPRSANNPIDPRHDSRPLNMPPPIATPLLPEAGNGVMMLPTSTATPAPTCRPSPTPTSTPAQPPTATLPAPTATPASAAPIRLIIPAIDLDVPVVTVGWNVVERDGQQISEWEVPAWRAAGWLKTSALIGALGNTVLEGHQDIAGRVFENLENLKAGDMVQVQTDSFTRTYVIALRTIVLDKDQPLDVRRENARWIGPSNDERLTLITCWPRNDNTHRLILVALPAP